MYLTLHKGREILLKGIPSLPLLVSPLPPLHLLHAVHEEHTLLGGCPLFTLLVRGPPPTLSCMPCLRSAH